ncbi:helix-turn-helix domain-containing protein [Lacticaseibacillus pabuli]|uniref:Helix-turn-helix domain-containing protein n=1 Tax=Lacticaseibacillus pabuli TaxID=3025672 RepID=A0ABY7WTV8_9LACO|nr:helix-turn-helix domain-containing protein [Lacticaseibacillus sp. KACC 23028]WDF83598.1 helix-turn-helix domain-containing protein [Lacticaseibacillus sp. KACC 23028]
MAEEALQEAATAVKKAIKKRLIDRNMSQKEVAEMIGITQQQMTRAVAGASGPRDVEIRHQIYKILDMKEER